MDNLEYLASLPNRVEVHCSGVCFYTSATRTFKRFFDELKKGNQIVEYDLFNIQKNLYNAIPCNLNKIKTLGFADVIYFYDYNVDNVVARCKSEDTINPADVLAEIRKKDFIHLPEQIEILKELKSKIEQKTYLKYSNCISELSNFTDEAMLALKSNKAES